MSLSSEDRTAMKQLHLDKANLFLSEADELFTMRHFSTAANRYYYACFHAIHALFVVNGIMTRTHDGLNTLFGLHFVKNGVIEPRFGAFVSKMESLRTKADYDVVYDVSEEDLREMQPMAHELITLINKMLS
ncbi:MAG: HEPN domain-containing protein [Paludibacteraceae bacterium]|nr:HEPN domain-containing protein [Paludibacteraceae bacterium]